MKELNIVIKLLLLEKKDIYLSILCGFIAGITAVGLFSASGYLISQAALAPPIYTLIVLVATVKMFGIISAISRYGERFYSHRGTFTMLSNLRVAFYENIEPLVPGVFHRFRSGDLLARIVGDVETLQNFFLRVFYPPIVLLLVFFSTILFTSVFSVSIAIVIFIGFLLTTFLVPILFALRERAVRSYVREERGKLSTEVTELFYGFRDLKIYQRLDERNQNLQSTIDGYLDEQEKARIHKLYSTSMNTFLTLIISVTVLGFGAYLITEGELDGIFLAMFLMVSLTVFENTTSMAVFPSHLEESRTAAKRLQQVVSEPPSSMKQGTKGLLLDQAVSIEMNDVSYTYPGEDRETLHGLNLSFPKGSKTVIVGPSGSGKSTVLQLLLKIAHPTKGSIKLGDEDLSDLIDESVWKHMNVVLQENHYFYGTIRENLQIVHEDLTDEAMNNALEKVELNNIRLDDKVLEKGGNLSGGEKQRLAIARALLKDAPIWILDEPTSSVDALTESIIYDKLLSQAADDTVILVSHRLNGLKRMDQIIVMDNGLIVEVGSYDALMQKKGYFYELKEIEESVF